MEEKIDALQNQFHDAVHDVITAYNSDTTQDIIDQAKKFITDALANIKTLLDTNPNEAGDRVVNPNPAE